MFIDCHSHQQHQNKRNISIINRFPQDPPPPIEWNVYYSIGLHPWHIEIETLEQMLINVTENAKIPTIIAIGETGIDKTRGVDLEIQKEIFIWHAQLAESMQMPLIIHCVKSHNEVFNIRNKINPTQPWILHGFNGSEELAMQAIENGFYISLGGAAMQASEKYVAMVKVLPQHRLLLESDESDIPVAIIYNQVARIKGLRFMDLKKIVHKNFKKIFKK